MKLHSDNGEYQTIRISREEFEEEGIKKGDLVSYGNTFYKIFGSMEDGHGNVVLLVENPVTVHQYS